MTVDQELRDRAAREIDTSWALSAGAGSGKTTVLVARTVELLAAGRSPAAVAAITFTEKAAREMSERVRDKLEERRAKAPPEEAAVLAAALARIGELTISTIHAFCQQLLEREALEADWAPGSAVISGTLGLSAVEQAYRAWRAGFDERHPDEAAPLRKAATGQALRDACAAALANRDLTLVRGAAELDWAGARQNLACRLDRLAALRAGCANPRCKLLEGNARIVAALSEALAFEDDEQAVRAFLDSSEPGLLRGGRKQDWPDDTRQQFVDTVKELRQWRDQWSHRIWEPLHHLLMQELEQHYLPGVEAAKQALAQVDFDDLLFRCEQLLRERVQARTRLASRFQAILVDEMQDTDPVQARIVALLARAPEAEGGWTAHPPRPGALFVVGDAKQSIYRFRRADLAVWEELHALVRHGGAAGALQQNFRSVPGIVRFVNRTFAGLPGYVEQVAQRGATELEPVVLVKADGEEDDETQAAVRYIWSLLRSGAVQPNDVMLLLPAWTKSAEVEQALLDAGIDALVEGGGSFFERDEVRLLRCAMRAIDEPGEGEAVVVVLRGLFGLSHRMLLAHKAAGGSWRYTVPEQPPGPATEAFAVLRRLHRRRDRHSWVVLIEELLRRTAASVVWSQTARGRNRLANLDKLREILRQLEPLCRSPAEVVERLEQLAKQKDADLPLHDASHQAVRITTLFKAKGLEAPVVVLLHARRQVRAGNALVDRRRGELALAAGLLRPADWEQRVEAEKLAVLEEMRRWVYVAATRARDQLVLVRADNSVLLEADMAPALESLPPEAICDPARLPAPPACRESFPGHDALVDELLARPPAPDPAAEERRRALAARVEASRRAAARWFSVTELARNSRSGRHAADDVVTGTVVHQVMEQLDLSAGAETLAARAPALVEHFAGLAELGPESTGNAIEIVRRLLDHPAVRRARSAPERWHEVPFAYPEGDRIVSGKIDLCFPADQTRRRWVVVDWKSDLPAPGHPRRADYERQIERYARAVIEALSGHAVESVERVLAGPHEELTGEMTAAALRHAAAQLREPLAAAIAAGLRPPEVGQDVGDPVYACLELAWEPENLGLALDLEDEVCARLESEGWTLVRAARDQPGWAAAAVDALRAALGA